MSNSAMETREVMMRGEAIYRDRIQPNVEPAHLGEFLVVNVLTGEYEMNPDDLTASRRAKARFGDAPLFTLRIGHPAAYRLGGHFRVTSS